MEDEYPSFCDGPLYIHSIPAIETLNMLFVQKFKDHFLWIDDVYLTGILAPMGNISKINLHADFLKTYDHHHPNRYGSKSNLGCRFVGMHMSGCKLETIQGLWNECQSLNF